MNKLLINQKKIIGFGAIFAVFLAIVLPIVAYASSLKVTNTLAGKVYDAYTLFTVNSDGDYLFNDNSGFKSGFDEYRAAHPNDFTLTLVEDGIYKVKANESFTEDGAKALAETMSKHYSEWRGEAIATRTAQSDTVNFNNIPDGYYIVHSSAGTVLSMVAVNGSAEIQEKNTQERWCTVNIDVQKNAVGYFQKVNVQTDVVLTQDYKGTEKSMGIVNEYLDNQQYKLYGVNKETISVQYGTYEENGNFSNAIDVPTNWYTINTIGENKNGYVIEFTNPEAEFAAGQVIRVINAAYGCKDLSIYNSYAGEKTEHKCTAHVFDTKWSKTEDIATASDTFRVLGMSATKLPDGSNLVLNGAKFKVYENSYSNTPLSFVKNENNYTVADSSTPGAINEIEAGVANINGLGSNAYYFEETQAPEGYNMLIDKVKFELNNDSDFAVINHQAEGDYWNTGGLTVINKQGIVLPSTGGIGTILFVVIGAGIIISVIAYRMSRKQKIKNFENSTI